MESSASQLIDFRLAERNERDAAAFCELSNSLYARPVNKSYYDWQFFQCPFASLSNVTVDQTDKIVANYTLHIQPAESPLTKVAWVLDIMVSPQIQRQGVFRRLVDFGFENIKAHDPAAIVVMANEKAYGACVNGLGWKRINTFFSYFANPTQIEQTGNFKLEYTKADDFSACDQIQKRNDSSLFANIRSAAYQNWRFIKNPRYDYDVFAAHKNGELFGYVVLKIFRDPVSGKAFGDIVDIQWVEDDKASLAEMFQFALSYFRQQNVGSVTTWLQTNTILDEIGVKSGFARSDQKRFFCGKALKDEFKHLEVPERWLINMSDSEVY